MVHHHFNNSETLYAENAALDVHGAIERLGSYSEVEEYLHDVFSHLQRIEQPLVEILQGKIRDQEEWYVSHVREGMSNYHMVIDFAVQTQDGGAVQFEIDYETPCDTLLNRHVVQDMVIRRVRAGNASRDVPELCESQMLAYILANSLYAVVYVYSPEAVVWLSKQAHGKLSLIDMLRHAPALWRGDAPWDYRVSGEAVPAQYDEHVAVRTIPIEGETAPVAVPRVMDKLRAMVARHRAQSKYPFEKWRECVGRAEHDTLLDDAARLALRGMADRIIANTPGVDSWQQLFAMVSDAEQQPISDNDWGDDALAVLLDALHRGSAEVAVYVRELVTAMRACETLGLIESGVDAPSALAGPAE